MTAKPAFSSPFATRPKEASRRNRFDSRCAKCNAPVKAGEGFLFGEVGEWRVEHADCEKTSQNASYGFSEGFYTVVRLDGSKTTFRIRTQDKDDDFMPDTQIVGYLDNTGKKDKYTNFGHLQKTQNNVEIRVWKRFKDDTLLLADIQSVIKDPNPAREKYAKISGRCSLCNRQLTVPSSLHSGLGPECAKKV